MRRITYRMLLAALQSIPPDKLDDPVVVHDQTEEALSFVESVEVMNPLDCSDRSDSAERYGLTKPQFVIQAGR